MQNLIINVDHVSKQYRLGQIGGTTLRDELQRLGAKIRRREDPTKRIGAMNFNYGETFMALDDVSFSVKAGERVGIIGRNGAGKSTLLKIISKITAPTSGTVGLNGRVTSMLEVGTGFHGELTGRENIYMNGAILGMTKREIDGKIEDIIDFSECRQFIDTPVKRYSSGMYVKLAFSVAAHLDSEILIMDEVLAVGDVAFREKYLNKMGEISSEQGKTTLYVSHNMNTIRRLCTRGIVLDKGKLIYDGNVEDAIDRYMDICEMPFQSKTDLSDMPRQKYISRRVLLSSAELHSEKNCFTADESMDTTLTVDSGAKYDGIRFMFVLISRDGKRIGKTESDNFSVCEGKNDIRIQIPLEGIADGSYYFEVSVLHLNSSSAREKYDSISHVFPFKVSNTEVFGITGESWNSNYWGNLMMKPIKIIDRSDGS